MTDEKIAICLIWILSMIVNFNLTLAFVIALIIGLIMATTLIKNNIDVNDVEKMLVKSEEMDKQVDEIMLFVSMFILLVVLVFNILVVL